MFWRLQCPCGHRVIRNRRPKYTDQKHLAAHWCQAMGFRDERSCPRLTPTLQPQEGSPGPTSLPFSLTALHFMFCGPYPVLYYLHHQKQQLPSARSSLHSQGEETVLRVGSQTGACRNTCAAAGRRPPSGGHGTPLQMLLSPVVGPVPPTKPIA